MSVRRIQDPEDLLHTAGLGLSLRTSTSPGPSRRDSKDIEPLQSALQELSEQNPPEVKTVYKAIKSEPGRGKLIE